MRTLKNSPHLILVKKSGKCQKNTLEIQRNYKTRKTRKILHETREKKY